MTNNNIISCTFILLNLSCSFEMSKQEDNPNALFMQPKIELEHAELHECFLQLITWPKPVAHGFAPKPVNCMTHIVSYWAGVTNSCSKIAFMLLNWSTVNFSYFCHQQTKGQWDSNSTCTSDKRKYLLYAMSSPNRANCYSSIIFWRINDVNQLV